MISLAVLEDIIEDQLARFHAKEIGIPREIDFQKYIKTKQITAIAGIRRGGKSTLLLQFSKKYWSFYYINFDDERLIDFTVKDFDNLMIAFQKKYEAKAIFLDEIQNIDKWERFARRLYEEGYKIFLTGSNAKLLSSELATNLTGRYFKIEFDPAWIDWARDLQKRQDDFLWDHSGGYFFSDPKDPSLIIKKKGARRAPLFCGNLTSMRRAVDFRSLSRTMIRNLFREFMKMFCIAIF